MAAVMLALTLLGCATNTPPLVTPTEPETAGRESRLRIGDQLQVRLETGGSGQVQAYDVVVDENGEITLPLVGRIKAEGAAFGELGERIQAHYVPRYYVRCTATVLVTIRFFYVGGEVRAPGRFNWTDDITLLKAISSAGGFTDYAKRTKVEVTRGKQKLVYDCEDLRQNPHKDFRIQPGDSIYVPRSIF
jgi:polysaccharide export outer membrane protein